MACPNILLVNALRNTAESLANGAFYAWGHHGACNCGNLLQTISALSKEEIMLYAQTGNGEWTELAEEYCPVSAAPFNMMISKLESIGLTAADIRNLEYLSNKEVLARLPGGFRWLQRNNREDVIVYFETFANMLEDELLSNIKIPASLLNYKPQPAAIGI